MEVVEDHRWIRVLQVGPYVLMVEDEVNRLEGQLCKLVLDWFASRRISKLLFLHRQQVLVLPSPFVSLALFLLGLEELVGLLFCSSVDGTLKICIVPLFKSVFIIFTQGIKLTNKIDVLAFETLVHIAVIDNFLNIVREV